MPTPDDSAKPTRWAGVPAADRVAARRALLLDAALELLGTEGWSGTSVRAVCQAARLNPRYFYESFADLDDLVVALHDRLIAELHEEVRAAVRAAGADARAALRATVETTVRFVDEDHRRARVLYVEALGNEKLNRRRLETGFSIASIVESDAAGRNRSAASEGGRIGAIMSFMLVGAFSELLVAWLDGVLDVERERLVDDATEIFAAMGDAAARISARRR
ncbi:TetR/AcrR family transcriptional regulator [Saccharopolyspora sp. CA-218241]|uniref:TetR/AcrR family transcriptional regulator n=1 Tax=Saccharopolyspora sp. CA-218241 TaxID=3240027 RepID=UPI003D99AF24